MWPLASPHRAPSFTTTTTGTSWRAAASSSARQRGELSTLSAPRERIKATQSHVTTMSRGCAWLLWGAEHVVKTRHQNFTLVIKGA